MVAKAEVNLEAWYKILWNVNMLDSTSKHIQWASVTLKSKQTRMELTVISNKLSEKVDHVVYISQKRQWACIVFECIYIYIYIYFYPTEAILQSILMGYI